MNDPGTTRQWSVDDAYRLVIVEPAPSGRSAALLVEDSATADEPAQRKTFRGGIEMAKSWAEARAGHYLAWRGIPDHLTDDEVLGYVKDRAVPVAH